MPDHDDPPHAVDDTDAAGDAVVVPGPWAGAWLLVPLRAGGTGQVWLATTGDPAADDLVVLKRQRPSMQLDIGDVLTSVGRLRDVTLDNVCRVRGFGVCDGFGWVSVSWIEGVDLHTLLELGRAQNAALSTAAAIAVARGLLAGLQSLHEFGLVHRDVTPANVVVGVDGAATLIDVDFVVPMGTAATDVVPGSVSAMSPEQAQGLPVDGRADLLVWAIVVYEAITGDTFYGDLPTADIWNLARTGGYRPRRFHEVPAPLQSVLLTALAPDPANRFVDAAACRQALDAAADDLGVSDDAGQAALAEFVETVAGARLRHLRQRVADARGGVAPTASATSKSTKQSSSPVTASLLRGTLELRDGLTDPFQRLPPGHDDPSASVMRPRSRHGAAALLVVAAVLIALIIVLNRDGSSPLTSAPVAPLTSAPTPATTP